MRRASEFLRIAQKAKNLENKAVLLQLAEAWRHLAERGLTGDKWNSAPKEMEPARAIKLDYHNDQFSFLSSMTLKSTSSRCG
jgi:hypothetical protein